MAGVNRALIGSAGPEPQRFFFGDSEAAMERGRHRPATTCFMEEYRREVRRRFTTSPSYPVFLRR
jgi:hypothetical protein